MKWRSKVLSRVRNGIRWMDVVSRNGFTRVVRVVTCTLIHLENMFHAACHERESNQVHDKNALFHSRQAAVVSRCDQSVLRALAEKLSDKRLYVEVLHLNRALAVGAVCVVALAEYHKRCVQHVLCTWVYCTQALCFDAKQLMRPRRNLLNHVPKHSVHVHILHTRTHTIAITRRSTGITLARCDYNVG